MKTLFCFSGEIAGGEASTVNASHSSILGGCANTIGANAVFSNIAGGCFNRIDADKSSIAGGCNNVVRGTDFNSHIAGSNITTNTCDTLHANKLWVGSLPSSFALTSGCVSGTFYYETGVLPFPFSSCKVVFVL